MSTAIVLAGHGSHISPETAGIVWKHVDALRALGAADEVTAAFWKETPSFHAVCNTLLADDITVVPLFTAQGYFTQTVIPAEMGLTGSVTEHDGRVIRYARTLSEHPYLGQVVRERVEDALRELDVSPDQAAVALIGHSTRRNPESRHATERQAAALRAARCVAQVEAVYLDDAPEIAQAYALTSAPVLIAVPFFLALGSHTTIDVPAALGLAPGQTHAQVNRRTVYYTAPVGTDDALLNAILELAKEANPSLQTTSQHVTGDARKNESVFTQSLVLSPQSWYHFPAAGCDLFTQTVLATGELRFGQLRVTPAAVHVWGDEHPDEVVTTPAELRTKVREQPFRPLAISTDLPGGWRVEVQSADMLHAVVETIYPGLIADWAAHQSGYFEFNTLEAEAARQTGMYRPLDQMKYEQRQQVVDSVCARCVRHPTWFYGQTPDETLPCPEACNLWLSQALETQ